MPASRSDPDKYQRQRSDPRELVEAAALPRSGFYLRDVEIRPEASSLRTSPNPHAGKDLRVDAALRLQFVRNVVRQEAGGCFHLGGKVNRSLGVQVKASCTAYCSNLAMPNPYLPPRQTKTTGDY